MKNLKSLLVWMLMMSFGFISAQEQSDSTKTVKDTSYTIEWGNKTIIVIEKPDKKDKDKEEEKESDSHKNWKIKQRYNHYAGVDFGVNGLLSESNSVDLNQEGEFMDLNYYGSWSIAFNFIDSYIPIAHEKFGVTIGMGIEFNKYKLSRDYTMVNVQDSTFGIVDSTKSIDKNLFKSTMVNLPIMFETTLGKDRDHSFYLAAGGMVSYRLGSKTKQIYSQDGEDYKVKNRSSYNMNPFRFSAVARIGYGNFTVFASYSLTPLFEKDKGPELYPFTVGVSLVHF